VGNGQNFGSKLNDDGHFNICSFGYSMTKHWFNFSVIRLLFFCLDIPKTNSGQAPEPKNQGCTEMAKILISLPKRKKLSRFFFLSLRVG